MNGSRWRRCSMVPQLLASRPRMHGEDANGAPPRGGARLAQYTTLLPLVTRALDGCPVFVVKVGVLSKEPGERTRHREHREAPLVVCSGTVNPRRKHRGFSANI